MGEIIDLPMEKRSPKDRLEEIAVALDVALVRNDDRAIELAVSALAKALDKQLELTPAQRALLTDLRGLRQYYLAKSLNIKEGRVMTHPVFDRSNLFEKLGQAFPEIL